MILKFHVWLLFLLFLFASFAHSQEMAATKEIVTDRPDVTEASIVIPKGSLQLENGISWTSDHSDRSLDFSETLVRFGVSQRTELRLVIPNYQYVISTAAGSGFSDAAIGLKQQLGPLPEHFDLSVIVAVSLPTGSDGVSSHGFDPFVKSPWSKELRKGWSLGGMQSLFWNTRGGTRNLVWEPTIMAEKEISEPWSVFVEYAGDFAQQSGSKQIAHFGSAYRVTPRQQVDCHFGFGLSPAAPTHFFAVGYSIRLDHLLGD